MLGWCIDANDLETRYGLDKDNLHKSCRHGSQGSKGMLECNCWCHTGAQRPVKRQPAKRKKVHVEPTDEIPVLKKRGRPKGSKNKPKTGQV